MQSHNCGQWKQQLTGCCFLWVLASFCSISSVKQISLHLRNHWVGRLYVRLNSMDGLRCKKKKKSSMHYGFCAHSHSTSLPSDLLHSCKTSGPESLQAEELHTLLMRRRNTHLTSISIFPSSLVWCLLGQQRPHFIQPCHAGVCRLCHKINISLAVGGRRAVVPSVPYGGGETHDCVLFLLPTCYAMIKCLYVFPFQ